MAQQGTPINQLTFEQLVAVKSNIESELHKLTQTIQLTNDTIQKTNNAKEALQTFSKTEVGKQMLVPMTESMYVTGTVAETHRPIIELGTGYFAETTVDNATSYLNRRQSRLDEQVRQLRELFKQKHQQYQIVVSTINQRLQQQQAAQRAAQK